MAALSTESSTPSALATCPHRIGRRLDGREGGHFKQASTSRSYESGLCFVAHRWQDVRSAKTFGDITNTRPDRSQPWKCFLSLKVTIVAECNNSCNLSPRSAVLWLTHAEPYPPPPMPVQAR